MKAPTLEQLKIDPQGQLALGSALVDAPAFARMLGLFGTAELRIAGATAAYEDADSRSILVTGSTELFGVAVTQLELFFDVASDDAYEFQFSGRIAALSLQTLIDRQILPPGRLRLLAALLDQPFAHVEVVFDSDDQTLYFGALRSDRQANMLQPAGLALERVGFELARHYRLNTGTFLLHATARLGSTAVETITDIPLGGALAGGYWALRSAPGLQLNDGLRDMVAFLGGTQAAHELGIASWQSVFPQALYDAIPALFLRDFELQFDPDTVRPEYIEFTIESAYPFTLPSTQLAIERVGLNLAATLGDPATASLTLFGRMRFSETTQLGLTVAIPVVGEGPWQIDVIGSAQFESLHHLDNLPINASAKSDLRLPDGFFTLKQLNLDQFTLTFRPGEGIERAVLAISSELECDIISGHDGKAGLALLNPALAVQIAHPFDANRRAITGTIGGEIAIGGLVFELSAEKRGDGWSFACSSGGLLAAGAALDDLASHFGFGLPPVLRELAIVGIDLTFSTTTGGQPASDLRFSCKARLPLSAERQLDAELVIELHSQGPGSYSRSVGGTLAIGKHTFVLAFSGEQHDGQSASRLIACFSNAGGPRAFRLHDMVAEVSIEAAALVPPTFEIDIKDVVFVYGAGDTPLCLFGVDLGAAISLANLPLVGQELGPDVRLAVDDLQIVLASRAVSQAEAAAINAQLPAQVARLPGSATSGDAAAVVLKRGLNASATLQLGPSRQPLALPMGGDTPAPQPATQPADTAVVVADDTKWFAIQKSFGPVHFARVGFQYKNQAIWFLLDASLSIGGLSLALAGLAVGSPIDHFAPRFDLRGLGLDYRNGAIEIGGAFLRTTVASGGETYDEYDGAAIIKLKQLALAAYGMYAPIGGTPTLFIYALLDYPIGGPSFFFVTGLAAGFGYNRALAIPPVEQVGQFPLVAAALAGASPTVAGAEQTTAALSSMRQYIPPAAGAGFLALGVRFTSFNMVDSFALLTVGFGERLALNLLGISTLTAPRPTAGAATTPLAEIQMAFRASLIPSEGILAVSAQLAAGSYLFSRACHLAGGFAFYSWFSGEHAGDFVLTVGGYHPRFAPPAHYPRVPRLALNWQVEPQLQIKGEAYFALTASAIMAGGQLALTWEDGNLRAWLNASADFLIAWQPYHYDARIYVDVGVSYTYQLLGTHHITADIGAELHVHGPEFGGTAHVKLWIISFDIAFGHSAPAETPTLEWEGFKAAFLPAEPGAAPGPRIPDEQIRCCSIGVKAGLVAKASADPADLGVIHPQELVLVTDSLIPATRAHIHNDLDLGSLGYSKVGEQRRMAAFRAGDDGQLVQAPASDELAPGSVAIGSMGVAAAELVSTHTIAITYTTAAGGGRAPGAAETEFEFTPVLKNAPAALWGPAQAPALGAPAMVDDTLAGFEIRPQQRAHPGETIAVARELLQAAEHTVPVRHNWQPIPLFAAATRDDTRRRDVLRTSLHNPRAGDARRSLAAWLGYADDLGDDATLADCFVVPPQIGMFN